MRRWLVAVAVLASASVMACKETKVEDTPETLAALDSCKKNVADKTDFIQKLEARLAEYEMKEPAGDDGEVLITIAGDGFEVTGGSGPHARANPNIPRGNADDQKLYEEFIESVNRSRGAIKKCYQNALKKNTALQARTVTLNVQVKFNSGGSPTGASFEPKISDTFNTCMRSITDKWKLPAAPRAVTFRAPVTLSPQ